MNLPLLAQQLTQQVVETPTTAFLKAGLLGAAVLALASVVVYLWREAKVEREAKDRTILELQEKRVAEAQAVAEQLLKSTEQCVTALTNSANALDAHNETMRDVQKLIIERRR